MSRSRGAWRAIRALGMPAAAFLRDPLRLGWVLGHLAEDDREALRRDALIAKLQALMLLDPRKGDDALSRLGAEDTAAPAAEKTLRAWLMFDAPDYWAEAAPPEGID